MLRVPQDIKIKIMLRILMFLLFASCPTYLYSQAYKNVCEFIRNKFKTSLHYKLIEGQFSTKFLDDDPYPDTTLHVFEQKVEEEISYQLKYYQIFNSGGIVLLEKFQRSFWIGEDHLNKENVEAEWFNIDVYNATKVYHLKLGNKEFLCTIGSGSDEYRLGTRQMIAFYNIFDITDPENIRYYLMKSRYSCIDNLGDFNHDGQLDFIKFEHAFDTESNNDFILRFLTLRDDKFVPLEEEVGEDKLESILFYRDVNTGIFYPQ